MLCFVCSFLFWKDFFSFLFALRLWLVALLPLAVAFAIEALAVTKFSQSAPFLPHVHIKVLAILSMQNYMQCMQCMQCVMYTKDLWLFKRCWKIWKIWKCFKELQCVLLKQFEELHLGNGKPLPPENTAILFVSRIAWHFDNIPGGGKGTTCRYCTLLHYPIGTSAKRWSKDAKIKRAETNFEQNCLSEIGFSI